MIPTRSTPTPSSPGRRGLLRVGAAGTLAAASSLVALPATGRAAGTAGSDPSTRKVVLVGANPGLSLFVGDELRTYVSAWRVDWSEHGSGTAVILWSRGRVHLFGHDQRLARWLERDFTRHFPEVEGLPWPEPVVHRTRAHVDIDLARGTTVRAGTLSMSMWDVRDVRTFATDDFPLGGVDHSLHLVNGPCFGAHGRVGGDIMEGEVVTSGTPERPGSSAFISEAEVWRR